jgi:hypothetical protein
MVAGIIILSTVAGATLYMAVRAAIRTIIH